MKRFILLAVFIIVSAGVCFSQANNTNISGDVTLIVKRNMYIDSFIYPLTYKGITMFMDDLAMDNTELHQKLLPVYEKLVEKNQKSKNIGNGIAIGGGVLIAAGVTLCIVLSIDTQTGDFYLDPAIALPTLIPAGIIGSSAIAFGLLGGDGGWYGGPNDNDFLDFVNKHNRANPDHLITVK